MVVTCVTLAHVGTSTRRIVFVVLRVFVLVVVLVLVELIMSYIYIYIVIDVTSCLRPSFLPSVGITFFLFFASGCGAARVASPFFHNNVGGACRNSDRTIGFLNILHFFIFKKSILHMFFVFH